MSTAIVHQTIDHHIGKGGDTGKHDINSIKIHDGDILKHPEHDDPYVIMWNDDEAGFVCENSTNFMLAAVWNQMKIVGNMRCNPELVGYTNDNK